MKSDSVRPGVPILLLALLVLLPVLNAETPASRAARAYRQANEKKIASEFVELLSIPNVAADPAGLRRNAAWIVRALAARGVRSRLLEGPSTPPAVYGELSTPGARRTLVFYAHYDGQPVSPKEWAGGDPFAPTLRSAALDAGGQSIPLVEALRFEPEWRLYGRSTSDDKAPILAMLAALDALRGAGIALTSNIKFFFEGEEEAGSPHLDRVVRDNRELLGADAWLICDGPVHQNRRQQIYFGARGVTGLELTVYGPRRELHSGHYGNWSPNPAMMLARLLATMTDGEGRVTIEGFYDGIEPLSDTEKKAIAEAPDFDDELRGELWLARADGSGKRLADLINLPSLNIRGLESVAVGAQARNVVPAQAAASIDIRLVKGLDHQQQVARVLAHIRRQGYFVTESEPDRATRMAHARIARVVVREGYNAARTSMDLPISREIIRAVEAVRGPSVKMPTLGGSVPLVVLEQILRTPLIGIPIVNHDNNQHSFNENIRIQNLWDGIELMAGLLTM